MMKVLQAHQLKPEPVIDVTMQHQGAAKDFGRATLRFAGTQLQGQSVYYPKAISPRREVVDRY